MFRGNRACGNTAAVVRSLFPVIEPESEPDRWRVRYDDLNHCDVSVSAIPADREFLNAVCVWRPCGDVRLWEAILQILGMGSVFIYWPGSPPIVADDEVAAGLPDEITTSLGPGS